MSDSMIFISGRIRYDLNRNAIWRGVTETKKQKITI
jgi:hypothetical protein